MLDIKATASSNLRIQSPSALAQAQAQALAQAPALAQDLNHTVRLMLLCDVCNSCFDIMIVFIA